MRVLKDFHKITKVKGFKINVLKKSSVLVKYNGKHAKLIKIKVFFFNIQLPSCLDSTFNGICCPWWEYLCGDVDRLLYLVLHLSPLKVTAFLVGFLTFLRETNVFKPIKTFAEKLQSRLDLRISRNSMRLLN